MKEEYRRFCRTEKSIPIFSKDFWLDAVCGENNWDVILIKRGDDIVASLPYYLKKGPLGLDLLVMPRLTQNMGVWIKHPEGQKYANRLSYEKEVMTELIEGLPAFSLFSQNFHYFITNWLPFYWKDFRQTTRYTYIIEGLKDLDGVFEGFKSNVKGKIRKAEKIVKVSDEGSIEDFYRINKMSFDRQKIKIPYSLQFLKDKDVVLEQIGCRKMFFAIDETGKIHAVLYLIWDEGSSYVHLVGEDPELRSSGAGILLLWEAIRFTAEELGLDRFDFEGSMIEGVEEVRRSFGATQKPYFCITKINSKILKIENAVRKFVRG